MKWIKKHKFLTAFLLILLLLVGTVVGFVISKLKLIDYNDGSLEGLRLEDFFNADEEDFDLDFSGLEEMEGFPQIPDAEIQRDDDVINILLLGTDVHTENNLDHARSDCTMIISINKSDKTVKLVSLERAIGVYMRFGEREGKYDYLTHAFRWGGAKLVQDCVEQHLRVEIDYYVRVTFDTVRTVVDAIGGVDLELTGPEAGALEGSYPYIRSGMNHLNGEQALAFARLRHIDSDWRRVERQRKVILAAVDAMKGANLKQLNDLLNETLPMIQTDMSMLQIADLMLYAPNFLQSEFDQMTIPQEGTYGYASGIKGFAVDYEVNSQILRDFLYGTGEDE